MCIYLYIMDCSWDFTRSMDWLKGKFAGTPILDGKETLFPIKMFPLNQYSE